MSWVWFGLLYEYCRVLKTYFFFKFFPLLASRLIWVISQNVFSLFVPSGWDRICLDWRFLSRTKSRAQRDSIRSQTLHSKGTACDITKFETLLSKYGIVCHFKITFVNSRGTAYHILQYTLFWKEHTPKI